MTWEWNFERDGDWEIPSHWAKDHLLEGHLDIFGYPQEDLSKAIVELVLKDPEDWTPKQKAGLARFKSDGSWNFADPESIAELKKWFEIYDSIFFNGTLGRYCQIAWATKSMVLCRPGTAAWCTKFQPPHFWTNRHPRSKQGRANCDLIIVPRKDRGEKYNIRINRYLQSILHEMTHAFIFLFTYYETASSGHDHIWQGITMTLERVAAEELGLELELNRELGMAYEMQEGGTLPAASVLENLKLDIVEIWEFVHVLREDNGLDRTEEDPFIRQLKKSNQLSKRNACIARHWTTGTFLLWENAPPGSIAL